ncbi:hypothetical protein [Spiroplasma sp. SV19]|uniref:hypothetical protein n=1 Tax=Spiroplasma sp. SV19 TaxID=2570468 RepID=UPI0024B7FDD9|nr:hypothetical protein [Spiroplasma sp. SV19]WHQ37191.1 hypothetical protein E7Y35_04790 [Spiroplasma sp. SV19]
MKPSQKMINQEKAEEFDDNEPIDYTIPNIPLDFAEQSQQSSPDLSELYSYDRLRTLYIYKINNLVKSSKKPALNYSQNSLKIGFIDKDDFIKIDAYEISDFNLKLQVQQNTTNQDNSTTYVMIDEKDIVFNEISKKDKEFLESYDLKLISINEPITEDNKNNTFIIEEYNRAYSPDGITVFKTTHLVKVTDFKWKNQNSIHLVLQKSLPESTIFKGIKIKSPKGALFGNIKSYGDINGIYSYPKTIVENIDLFPLFSMPIETNPGLRILQNWFGKSFLPWNIAKNYVKEKDILELLSIKDDEPSPRQQTFKNARVIKGRVGFSITNTNVPPNWPLKVQELPNDKNVEKIIEGGVMGVYQAGWLATAGTNDYGDIVLEFEDAPIEGKLKDVMLNYLTYRYNYDRKFPGAEYDEKGNPVNDSAKLRQKFEGQKPEDVIDGLFEEWKFNNPTYLMEQAVQNFKQIIYMLSNYSYTRLAVNKGYNDDYKILLPYYFELISKPVQKEQGYWEFTDCIVKLNSLYFDFTNLNKVICINKDISANKLYKLEANYYNWLSITNELESNKIPSLIPGEIKLDDGEYGKYLVSLLTTNVNKCLELFSNNDSNIFSRIEMVKLLSELNSTDFKLLFDDELKVLTQIQITGIWTEGKYDITILTEDMEIEVFDIKLFDKMNESLSLISLEI